MCSKTSQNYVFFLKQKLFPSRAMFLHEIKVTRAEFRLVYPPQRRGRLICHQFGPPEASLSVFRHYLFQTSAKLRFLSKAKVISYPRDVGGGEEEGGGRQKGFF